MPKHILVLEYDLCVVETLHFLTPHYQNNRVSLGTKPEDPNNTVCLIHLRCSLPSI